MMDIRLARRACVCAVAAIVAACNRDLDGPTRTAPPAPSRRIAGVVEITFHNIGSPNMTSSAIVGASVAEVEAIRAAQLRQGSQSGARLNLSIPEISTGVPSNATIQLALAANGATSGATDTTRYFSATYRVRNAQLTDGAALGTPRRNLTFVAVGDVGRTIGDNDTPVLVFNNSNNVPIQPAILTRLLRPSGLVVVNGGGAVTEVSPDIVQVFTEQELTTIPPQPDVTNVFPYGFVVHHVESTSDRILPADPLPDQFDGEVTFAYRIRLQDDPTQNPTTITVLMLGLDDDVTKVTQSLEEQTPAAAQAVADRAAALGATEVRILAGGSVPTPIATELFCAVRTAGLRNAATASLTNPNIGTVVSLNPSPGSAAARALALNATIAATFSSNVSGVGPTNFKVRGSISGQQFLTGPAYNGQGTPTITTPPGAFLLGEDVDVTLTSSLACPTFAARLKVNVIRNTPTTDPSTVDLSGSSNPTTGTLPRAVAIGDFTGDGNLDLAFRTGGDATPVTIQRGPPGFNQSTNNPISGFTGNTNTGGIVAADFNGDGKLDLAFVNGNDLKVYLGDVVGTNPTFIAAPGVSPVGTSPGDLAVADFNGDGNLDLLITFPDHVSVLLGTGTGAFLPPIEIQTGVGTRAAAIGDLNGDGDFDIVVAVNSGTGATIQVYLGNGDGTFKLESSATSTSRIAGMGIGDMNNDGTLDVVTADSTGNSISVRPGNGDGTLGTAITTAVILGGNPATPGVITIADKNGDGNLDVLAGVVRSGQTDAQVTVLLGDGAGGFGAGNTQGQANGVGQIGAADFNKDGTLDMAIPQLINNNFRLYTKR